MKKLKKFISSGVVLFFGQLILKLYLFTIRVQVVDKVSLLSNDFLKKPFIAVFWHQKILALLLFYRKKMRKVKGHTPISAMVSASKDGAITTKILEYFGIKSAVGSSSKRGSIATKNALAWLEAGGSLAMTPDGPRGPKHHFQEGALKISELSSRRIISFSVFYSHCYQFKSWDSFQLPLPFSRVDIILKPFSVIPPNLSPESFEKERKKIEKLL